MIKLLAFTKFVCIRIYFFIDNFKGVQYNVICQRGRGGTGRRARFRFQCSQGRGGSSPLDRTIHKHLKPLIFKGFLFSIYISKIEHMANTNLFMFVEVELETESCSQCRKQGIQHKKEKPLIFKGFRNSELLFSIKKKQNQKVINNYCRALRLILFFYNILKSSLMSC